MKKNKLMNFYFLWGLFLFSLIFYVARWAENCYFIKVNEDGYSNKSILEITTEMFSYCDGFYISVKKDDHFNIVEI